MTQDNTLSVFAYEGNNVTFRDVDGTLMINATEMAKPFGKKPNDWLRLPSSKDFIFALETKYKSDAQKSRITSLVLTNRGNSQSMGQGTWMVKEVAIEFARWLSPMFGIWCNDMIMELLTKGHVSLMSQDEMMEQMMANPRNFLKLVNAYAEEKEKNEEAQKIIGQQRLRISQQQKDIEYLDPLARMAEDFMTFEGDVSVQEFAKALSSHGFPTGPLRLYGWLRDNGFLIRGCGQNNQPYQKHIDNGLFTIVHRHYERTDPFSKFPDNTYRTFITTKGQKLIWEMLDKQFPRKSTKK